MGPPWLIPMSLGDSAGCSVQSQVPLWVISSTALVLIEADILMSGAEAWSARLNLPADQPPLLCQCPLFPICPFGTVGIRPNLTLYGLVRGQRCTCSSFTWDYFHWRHCLMSLELLCCAEWSTSMLFCVPPLVSLSFSIKWSGFKFGLQRLLCQALLCRHDVWLISVLFVLNGLAM